MNRPDAIVVGAGLAGLVATHELVKAGRRVLVLDQENRATLGGQAFWSLGGLFFVDSPEQRRLGINDSLALARQDWMGSAQFDRLEDYWPRRWAEAYVEFAATEKRGYLRDLGLRVAAARRLGRAGRRTGAGARQLGAALPCHVGDRTRGRARVPRAGARSRAPGARVVRVPPPGRRARLLRRGRRRCPGLGTGAVSARTRGPVLAQPDRRVRAASRRGARLQRRDRAQPRAGPAQLAGRSPRPGSRAHDRRRARPRRRTDAGDLPVGRRARHQPRPDVALHRGRSHNWNPIWPDHAIRIIPGPSSLWLDATGRRLDPPCFPGYDTTSTLKAILAAGYDYSWFILTQSIIEKEFALSGSEQNPDITGKDRKQLLSDRVLERPAGAGAGVHGPRRGLRRHEAVCASWSTG